MAAATTGKKLYECPTNVKEALDWLEALGRNANDCATVIKQQGKEIIKDFNGNVDDVCQKAREFSSAIKKNGGSAQQTYKADGWTTMCQDAAGSGGGKCCGSGGKGGCSNCSNPSSCNGCCAKCPKQICARIFCLIVPVLRNVLMYLYDKCAVKKNKNGEWTGKITDNDIGKFFTACGFNTSSDLNGSTEVNGILSSLINLGGALNSVYTAISNALGQADSNTFLQGATTVPVARTPSQSPNSICDLLLWLQFLPYSTNYKDVKEKLDKAIPKNSQDFDTYLKEFTSSIPMLFLFIEGKGKEQNKGSSIFQHIATLSKCEYVYEDKYYKKPEDVVKMLVSAMPVLYWSIDQMKDKCTQGDNCQQSVKECDKMWKFLSLMGWKKDSSDSDHNIEGNMKCSLFKKYIEKELIGGNDSKGRLNDIKAAIENAWKDANGQNVSASSGSHLPRTIYEMLIWLMGLPVSDKFKELKEKIQTLSNNGVQLNDVMQSFTEILFEVPQLFLTLNGDLSGLLGDMYTFHGIETGSSGGGTTFNYGNDGSESLKIFSAIVAILFPVIRYLQQRCMNGGSAFVNGESWQNTNTNTAPLSEFLKFMGFPIISSNNAVQGSQFHTTVLQPIFGDLTGQNGGTEKLQKLYECAIEQLKKNSTGGSHTPTTIRQMMLWLIGLPVTTQYGNGSSGLMQTVTERATGINDVSSKIKNGNNDLEVQLQHSIVGMMTIISQIEGGLGSVLTFLKEGFKDKNGGSTGGTAFEYKSGDGLFTSFTTYVTSVHVQLRFLMVMCKTGKDQGGWKECVYSTNGSGGSNGVTELTCKCNGNPNGCPQLLKRFLQNGNSGGDGNKFKLMNGDGKTEHLKMGFNAYSPQSSSITGASITPYLEQLLDDIPTPPTPSPPSPSTSKPLSLLTQYCVAIGKMDPSSLGDLFAFFAHLGQSWDSLKLYGNGGALNEKLTEELTEYPIGTLGEKQACNELKKKITAILTAHNSTHDNDRSLMSLMCSTGTSSGSNSCTPYMKSLNQGLYHYYCPEITGAGEPTKFGAFQYLYDMLKKLLDKMKELKKEFDNCECCKQSGKPCTDLISCPNAHPILYKFGFVFGNPSKLTGKKCTDIKKQLGVVLSCTKGSESALFMAFECVIQVTYKVLLEKAKGCVTTKYDKNGNGNTTADGLQSTNTEMNTAFMLYVSNAMYLSYPKLICTFACKVFDGNHECEGDACKERFKKQITKPANLIPSTNSNNITVSSSTVTSITAVIPQYTAPVIDRYHYKTYKKGTTTTGKASDTSGNSTPYTFQSAIDFHVSGANCIRPTPVALRSVIDWMLRVTTGAIATQKGDKENGKNNDNIKQLSEAIKSVLKESVSVTVTGDVNNNNVQSHLNSLVTGLRTFMGYEDKSESVIKGVSDTLGTNGTNGNGVKGELQKKITAIDGYLKNKENFGSELGKALLKGRYEGTFKERRDGTMNTIISTIAAFTETITGIKEPLEQKTFKDVVKTFSDILKLTHEGCKELQCNTLNNSAAAAQSNDQNDGLKLLKDFFEQLKTFATLWNTIGSRNGSGILQQQKGLAATEVSQKCNGSAGSSSSNNGQYFKNLYQALAALGECAQKVQALDNKNNGVTDSKEYRNKITELITGLNAFGTHIAGCNFNAGQDTQSNDRSNPVYAVKGAEELIKKTISNVQVEITKQIKKGVEVSITMYTENGVLKVSQILNLWNKQMEHELKKYQSHLDDLKRLCQWLYRMGQLYANGLKGFVESLIEHLKHIITVIRWIEKLAEHLKWLNDKIESFDSEDRRGIVGLCKVGIENLLHGTYVLNELPDGSSDKEPDSKAVATRIKVLNDLRLLALDRYTLQVWQDECKDGECKIKDWITFKDGIIRHSNLNAIKEKLCDLTGISYTATVASPAATPSTPRNRIHDFHAICVIQKFSYEAPIAELERSLEKLTEIKDKLEGVKQKCDNRNGSALKDDQQVKEFCKLVDEFLKEPYGIYSFAKFVHTILGPNIFSAVIGATEELKEANKYQNGGNGNLEKIKGILGVMTEGLDGENNTKNEHYKLENICKKLEAFITTLRREYIFAYPVVTATATQAIASPPNPSAKNPTCDNRGHSRSSICKHCYPYLAKIFIGAIPNLYRHCRLLYEMCDIEPGYWYNDILSMGYEDYYNRFMLSLSAFMSHQGYEVLTRDKDGVMHPSAFKYELDPTMPGTCIFDRVKAIVSGSDALSTTTTDSSLMPLESLFKAVMQHFKEERNKKKEEREKKEKAAFETKYKDSGLTFQAPPAPLPSTVRQVLFWLHEMDTNKEFYDAMLLHIDKLCRRSSIPISHDTILHVLKLSITQCLEVLATIEDPGRQNPLYYFELYTEEHYYDYPVVNIPLFFYTFVEKLMAAFLELNFVCVQCQFRATEGGWSECHIGEVYNRAYEVQGSVCCICHERKTVGTPIHAVTVSGSVVCPRPLSAFLFSDQKNQLRIPNDVSQRSAYMSKGTMPCGFQLKNKAITDAATRGDAHNAPTAPAPTSVSGSVLVEPLRKLVGGHVTGRHTNTQQSTLRQVIYLRDLLRYTLCLAVRPPWSMSENMAFFYRVTEAWKDKKGVGGVTVALPNTELLQSIHNEISLFPGMFEGERLTTAVERFAGLADNNKHGTRNATHSNTSHQYDLKTLMGCQEMTTTGTSTTGTTPVLCSPFMFPLSLDVYTHYDHKNSRAYLSWILNFAFGIYGQLKALEEMIKGSACVRNGSQSPSSSCPLLPMCPGVLTALYQSGSSFMDQGQLAKNTNAGGTTTTTKKTCRDFHSVLNALFNCETSSCTPLHNLIVQCEAFLWSIRLPFSLVQLSLWSVAILFISYVFVVPLDHFKIKSHLFNRLKYTMHPSLLIADQQRRVSEVAYFSL